MNIPFFSQRKSRLPGDSPAPKGQPVDIILNYHEETKHHFHRYARSLGYLDWDNQPDPFRRFPGARLIELPLLPQKEHPLYDDLFKREVVAPVSLNLESLSRFFRNSLAISAWKRYGSSHWALRVNPSSGNLHPTEAYLMTDGSVPEVPAGVYHYAAREHGLEQRVALEPDVWTAIAPLWPTGAVLVGLTSIHWREAWKYGERAFRYCQHDVGHALAALRISAAVLGWQLQVWESPGDSDLSRLLGLDRPADFEEAENEQPDLLAVVIPSATQAAGQAALPADFVKRVAEISSVGHANRLSASHAEWSMIDDAAQATWKPPTQPVPVVCPESLPEVLPAALRLPAERIIQQRRSCLSLDGETAISSASFYRMLMRTVPRLTGMPFDALQSTTMQKPRIHLAVFVHLVTGIPRGLYLLARDPEQISSIRDSLHHRFLWETPDGCPGGLDLFLLEAGDFRRTAVGVSCGQEIGGEGAFSLGMIAEFERPVREIGAWFYRRLFWEAGMIGQVLYLEAEAAGIRSTGIGCYFDDPMHEMLGLRDRRFQSLYHFTVGGPVEDTRLTTEPAYDR